MTRYPTYFGRMRGMNRRGPAVYGTFPTLPQLTAAAFDDLRGRGAAVVDVRPVADYACGHVPRSLANTLRPQFASWLGWLVEDPETPLVFVTDPRTDRRELVRQCLNIGYEHLAGEMALAAWQAAGGETTATPLVGADQLAGAAVLDVRQDAEFASGHIPGAGHVELGALPEQATNGADRPVVVMCGHGERAATAASVLEAAGRGDIAILDGGPDDWAATSGEPLEVPP